MDQSSVNASRRAVLYSQLSDLVHDLLLEIYGTYDNFIKADPVHPLEDYILSYDYYMEEDGILIELGRRIGFGIDHEETGAYTLPEQFYDRCSYTIRNNSPNNITKIMNMTEKEFESHLKSKAIEYNEYMYEDRLNIDSHKYNKQLINAYIQLYKTGDYEPVQDRLSFVDEGVINSELDIVNPDIPTTDNTNDYEDKYEDEVMDVDEIRYQIVEGENEEELEKNDEEL
jgi:hypothetical protein